MSPFPETGRQPGRQNEYEEERRPSRDGEPPRPAHAEGADGIQWPAQEPPGSEGSSNSGETATDPATGQPNP